MQRFFEKTNPQIAIAAVVLLLFSMNCFAQQSSFPSHCSRDETVLLSAKMKNIVSSPEKIIFKDSGKILSLCASINDGHTRKLAYRFGSIGNVELEEVATTTRRFGKFSRQPVRHVGEDIYFFNKGEYTYYILVASGMGSGISLRAFQGDKQIVDLFSGNDAEIDYHLGRLMSAKPVLVQRTPKHLLD